MVRVSQPISALAQGWQTRLQHYQTALEREPLSVQAWQWRIEIKVLRFLLSRYGSAADWGSPPAHLLAPTPSLFIALGAFEAGKKPRSRAAIRHTLQHIATVNRTTAKW